MADGIYEVRYPVDAMPYQKVTELIGKSDAAVKGMVDAGKLPLVPWVNPENPNPRRAENWVFIPEFNRAMRDAYINRRKNSVMRGYYGWGFK